MKTDGSKRLKSIKKMKDIFFGFPVKFELKWITELGDIANIDFFKSVKTRVPWYITPKYTKFFLDFLNIFF